MSPVAKVTGERAQQTARNRWGDFQFSHTFDSHRVTSHLMLMLELKFIVHVNINLRNLCSDLTAKYIYYI